MPSPRQPSTRQMRRAAEREAARNARKAEATKPDGAKTTADDPAVAAAAAAMAAGADGATATPPLTMDQIPPEAQGALTELLKRTGPDGPPPPEIGKESSRRAKKFITLERELAELLTFPAGPALMAGDQFCGEHFAVQGPQLARQLTIYSETHPSTFDTLQWMARQGSLLVIATSVVGYLLPPAIHHGLPAPDGMRRHYGMEPHAHPPDIEPDLAAVA